MSRSGPRPTPERVASTVTGAILLALAGAIVFLWVQPRQPASVNVVMVGDVRLVGSQSYVTCEVRNGGDETAEAVQVVGELTVDGEVVAVGEQFIDFLSGGETEQVVFIFDRAAPDAETTLRVASYKIP